MTQMGSAARTTDVSPPTTANQLSRVDHCSPRHAQKYATVSYELTPNSISRPLKHQNATLASFTSLPLSGSCSNASVAWTQPYDDPRGFRYECQIERVLGWRSPSNQHGDMKNPRGDVSPRMTNRTHVAEDRYKRLRKKAAAINHVSVLVQHGMALLLLTWPFVVLYKSIGHPFRRH